MKSAMIWALVVINAVLGGMLLGRYVQPNVAQAQGVARPGDYNLIPVDFTSLRTGVVAVVDNATGILTIIATDESTRRMEGAQKLNLTELFDRASGRSVPEPKPRR
jgi:hypothetical protein